MSGLEKGERDADPEQREAIAAALGVPRMRHDVAGFRRPQNSNTPADFDRWPELSKTILVTLMFIGACARSTGGGLKVARIIILVKSMRLDIFRTIRPRGVRTLKMDGRSLEEETVRGVRAYFVTYMLLFVLSNLILSFNGLDAVTNFTAVTATFNNIGPGLSLVGPMGNYDMMPWYAKYTLMFDMLAGRLELYPMLLLVIPAVWRKR